MTLDSTTNVYVTGTIGDKSSEDLLYVNTAQGEMQIKLDPSTNMSGCSVPVSDTDTGSGRDCRDHDGYGNGG